MWYAHCRRIVQSCDLEEKLCPLPQEILAQPLEPHPPLRIDWPGRPDELKIVHISKAKVPSIEGIADPYQRGRIIHAFAHHELQAAELFAWAALAFADAPEKFLRGLLAILADEQRHTRMYIERLREGFGVEFGEYPVSAYFWNKAEDIHTPKDFISAMSLTFENANLDHTEIYATACREIGDEETAAIIDQIQQDETNHVAFGWRWLQRFKAPDQEAWEAWTESLSWPLQARSAKGDRFHREHRLKAGLSPDFVERLEGA